jgi:hypothetical protein
MKDSEQRLPKREQYVHALTLLESQMSPTQRDLLVAHWSYPAHTASASQLARAVGKNNFGAVNLIYGRLGRMLREEIAWDVEGQQSFVIAWFDKTDERGAEYQWHMHQPLADALEQLGWVEK